jgi:colanic acid biosynthesis glycosyl transferase WcaI
MRILFFTENFPPETNAAATRVFERAVYWARWGHDITIITCFPNFPDGKIFSGYENKWYKKEMIDGIKVIRVKTYIAPNKGVFKRSLDFFSFFFTGLIAGLFQPRPNVIVATSPQPFSAVAGWALSWITRKPFIFELGDLWPRSMYAVGIVKPGLLFSIMESLELFLYRQSACIVALTQAFKVNLVNRNIPEAKIHVVINGVDLPRYQGVDGNSQSFSKLGLEKKFVVGYVGTLGMAHDLENVLSAASLMADNKDIMFLFVGSGADKEKLENIARRESLKNVIFLGRKPKEIIPEIWNLCNIALVHLKNEAAFSEVIPSKIFEAMGMGLPILLVSPKGEASQLVELNKCGEWVPSGDPQTLSVTIESLASDMPRLKNYSRASKKLAPSYSREVQAEKFLKVMGTYV